MRTAEASSAACVSASASITRAQGMAAAGSGGRQPGDSSAHAPYSTQYSRLAALAAQGSAAASTSSPRGDGDTRQRSGAPLACAAQACGNT